MFNAGLGRATVFRFCVAFTAIKNDHRGPHLDCSFGFWCNTKPIVSAPHADPVPMGVPVCTEETEGTACEQLPAVDSSCSQQEIEIAVHPGKGVRRGKELERAANDPTTLDVAVPAEQPH